VLAAALGAWFLAEAHGLYARVRADQSTENTPESATESAPESAPSPAPMRLFHLSIAYLTLLFAAVAVTALLPWGRW
jgi:heme o synthase